MFDAHSLLTVHGAPVPSWTHLLLWHLPWSQFAAVTHAAPGPPLVQVPERQYCHWH